jgi:hypothetical protein
MLMIVNDVQIKSGQLPLSETPKGPREGAPEERVSARAVNDTVTLSDSGQKMVNLNRGAELGQEIKTAAIDENFADKLKRATDDIFRVNTLFRRTMHALFNWWKR